MLETKEQKQILAGCLILVLILSGISLFSHPNLTYKEPQIVKKDEQNILRSKAYLDYFAAANIDKQASDDLFNTILTKEDVQKEVEQKLNVTQKITPPILDQSKIKISADTTEAQVNEYLASTITDVYDFNLAAKSLSANLFTDTTVSPDKIEGEVNNLINKLYSSEAPKEAESMHKALITAYLSYKDFLQSAKSFNADYSQDENFWPEVYKNYVIANDSSNTYQNELGKLSSKYNIAAITIHSNYAVRPQDSRPYAVKILIPEAQAFLGLTFTFSIGDIPSLVMDAVKEGLRSAFLQFMGAMLNKLVTKIEQNYAITNFLYYTDALVNGQYVEDYLNKYVNDPLDKIIVKKLIPQYNCGVNPDLKSVFQAQANQYLGYDPASVSINDPDYYEKMARAGDFMATPAGWQQYYDGLASQAENKAQKSAEDELTSSGLKTPRSVIGSSISSSINSIISAERASLTAVLQLGINNAESIISSFVAQLTQTLVNKFVFQGVSGNSGSVAVLKEQKTCVSTPVISPILPLPETDYIQPGPPPTQQAVLAQQCSAFTSENDDCTVAVIGELKICAQNPSAHTGSQSCTDLANSVYVNTKLSQCNLLIRKTQDCLDLLALLNAVH
jgi:hypothetical protein